MVAAGGARWNRVLRTDVRRGMNDGTNPLGTRVIALHGAIDLYTAPDARNTLLKALEDMHDPAPCFVADLSDVTMIDSSGWGVLVGQTIRLDKQGGVFRLAAAAERVRKMYELMRLAKPRSPDFPGLALYDSVSEALNAPMPA